MRTVRTYRSASKGRGAFPSMFYADSRKFSRSDRLSLGRQVEHAPKGRGKHFSYGLIRGVARRCPHGVPQVLICDAFRGASPFPTTYWLTCPYLLAELGRLESQQRIAEMERTLSGQTALWRRYHTAHAILRLQLIPPQKKRFLRLHRKTLYRAIRLGGVGGIDYRGKAPYVKCLHLQTASYLGMGYHPASHWLLDNLPALSCRLGFCATQQNQTTEEGPL